MLNQTGAWNSPIPTSAHQRCSRQLWHPSSLPPTQQTVPQHAAWEPDTVLTPANRHRVHCRCSTSVSRIDSFTPQHITAALPVQEHVSCSSDTRVVALSATHHQQRSDAQQSQHTPHMQPGQHVAVALHSASHAIASAAAQLAATIASTDWRILQLQNANDRLSAQIVSCKSVQQLQNVGKHVCQQGNKLQILRFTVMAAILVQQQMGVGQHSHAKPTDTIQPTTAVGNDVVELIQQVVKGLVTPTLYTAPALITLNSRFLTEALYALQLLQLACDQQQQQQIHQQLRAVACKIPEQSVLSAIHACSSVDQLSAVLSFLQEDITPQHTKAAFVQLARLYDSNSSQVDSSSYYRLSSQSSLDSTSTSSSSDDASVDSAATAAAQDLAGLLMALLEDQQAQLQPHAAASIVWSIGQCQPLLLLVTSEHRLQQTAQQLLEFSLSDLHRLNHRVCAMLLHGAARLQLQLTAVADAEGTVQQLLQHTQQQLEFCYPQAMSTMLWSFAQLQIHPGADWLQAFYSRSLQLLQPQQQQGDATSSHRSSGRRLHNQHAPPHIMRQQAATVQNAIYDEQQRHLHLQPLELAAVLSAVVQLKVQAPTNWLSAVASSCCRQMQQFEHQELALMLWSFAKLQHLFVPPHQLLVQAGLRVQQLLEQSSSDSYASGGSLHLYHTGSSSSSSRFSPKSLTLLLYSVARLQLQPQQQLLQHLWQDLQQDTKQGEESISHIPVTHVVSAAAGVELHSAQSSSAVLDSQSSDSGVTGAAAPAAADASQVSSWVAAVYCQPPETLWQYNAQDLALLAWGLARQQQQQNGMQHRDSKVQPVASDWLAMYLYVAAKQLQQGEFTSQGISMMLWGLGTILTSKTLDLGSTSSSAGTQLSSSAAAAAFWAAAEQQTIQKLAEFSSLDVANLLWGAGALSRHSKAFQALISREWIDLLACHCLDGVEQLSGFQLVSALQALIWLKHPRGLHLLQQALSEAWLPRLFAAGTQELLLLLRACVFYKFTPASASLQRLLMVLRRQAGTMAGGQVAQMLYLLGKMQQQHIKRQNQLVLQQLSAAKTTAVAGCKLNNNNNTRSDSSSSSGKVCKGSPAVQQQQMQQAQASQQLCLVPGVVQCELVQHISSRLAGCSVLEVSLMIWGLSQLAAPGQFTQQCLQQQQSQPGEHAGTTVSSKRGSTASGADEQQTAATVFAELPVARVLLHEVYHYSRQHLQQFSANQLAMLLYALHKLGVLKPPPEWLTAVIGQLSSRLGELHGQGLAALIMSLSAFNWVPSRGWLDACLAAVTAVDAAGGLNTEWQQACVLNGLSALDPMTGQKWLHRMSSRSRASGRAANSRSCSSDRKRSSPELRVGVNGMHGAAAQAALQRSTAAH